LIREYDSMSIVNVARKEIGRGKEIKRRSGYLTTTELARLCGVSRFTIINWTKQGRIKATRTVGRHYRIPVSEALSLLRSFKENKKASSSGSAENCQQQKPMTSSNEECGNCLTSDEENKKARAKKKNILYVFGYGFGRSANILKKGEKSNERKIRIPYFGLVRE
jgi:excisionase family DNA binding protein